MKYQNINKRNFSVISFLVLILLIVVLRNLSSQSEFHIILTPTGFNPTELSIKKGDTVVFSTELDKPFWPASDLHPTHGIYPEFDPKKPITPGESWSFKVTREGIFSFHDHLFPNYRGTIISGDILSIEGDCIFEIKNKPLCWTAMIDNILKTEGLSQAFDLVENLYQTEPAFALNCHQYLHQLGEATYQDFLKDKEISLNKSSAYCGYGFYHGFMGKLLLESRDYSEASNFCKEVALESTQTLVDACYHGAGHGAVSISVIDSDSWGDSFKIINNSLFICNVITDNAISNSRCASGVFMEIAEYMATEQYGLLANTENPFQYCETLNTEETKMPCYTQMYSLLRSISNGSLVEAVKYIESIPEDKYALEAIETLLGSNANLINDPSEGLEVCRGTQERLRLKCIRGIALVYMLNGEPNKEYKKAIGFCNENELSLKEKDVCYELIMGHARHTYSDEDFKTMCLEVDKKYLNNCLKL